MGNVNIKLTGQRIKEIASAKGYTVESLALALQTVSIQAIYKWYRGDALPSIDNLVSLSILLDTPIEQLLVIEKNLSKGRR